MSDPEFDKVKKLVRSVLLPCQRGSSLRDFLKAYRELNGIHLPWSKLGYKSDLHLLQHMSDAVYIQQGRSGEVLLHAVADESTQHIQKMVSKQKAPKHKPSFKPSFGSRFKPPPRFLQSYSSPQPVASPSYSPFPKTVAPSLKKKIMNLVERFPSGLSLSEFMQYFEWIHGEKLAFKNIGFFTLEECLENVPEISMKTQKNEIFVYPKGKETLPRNETSPSLNGVTGSATYSKNVESNYQPPEKRSINVVYSPEKSKPQIVINKVNLERSFSNLSTADESRRETASFGSDPEIDAQELEGPDDIPPFVLRSLRKLAELYPDGIRATDFPSVYEKVINTEFDLHSLGYNDLSVFIDAVPNIFKREDILGVKRNWLIVPAGRETREIPNKSAILHDTIISNIRTLLEANPEGILIDEFLHIYSINCLEPLCIGEFGFISLESFLMCNGDQVPLKIASGAFGKVVHLVQSPVFRNPEPQMELHAESLPDVVLPGTYIPTVKLPANLNYSEYFQAYLSTVENPSRFYIQLKGPNHNGKMLKLYDEMEAFYRSPEGDLYKMKSKHIKVDTVCIAVWPPDKHWYRVKILSIPSLEEVQVFYFDYGTRETIPVTMLRYLKKEYSDLPAQALLSTLAALKPAHNARHWDQQASNRLLQLCMDVPLMAKIDQIHENGTLSLILCDTNGAKDVFINDVLLNEGLADTAEESIPVPALLQAQLLQACQTPEKILAVLRTLSPGSSFIPPPAPVVFPISPPIPAPTPPTHFPSSSGISSMTASSSPTDSEVFDDDDDMFEQFYQKVVSVMKRYVKRVRTVDAYIFHMICVDGKPFVSCGDIAALIWNKQDSNYLLQRLQNRDIHLPSIKILESANKDMFYQFERFYVRGSQKIKEGESEIELCPLSNVIEILNLLGQPSTELRRQIQFELENFNPSDPTWMELSEGEIPDKEEVISVSAPDEDRLNRLCLFDLIAMKESIRLSCEKVQHNMARGGSGREDLMRMEQLLTRVVQRINQIKEICQTFRRLN